MTSSFLKRIQDYNFVGAEEVAVNRAITAAGGPPLRDPVACLNALARLDMSLPFGLDSLPILATIAGLQWRRSLFPMSGGDFRQIVAAVILCPVETNGIDPELLKKAEIAAQKFPVVHGESPALGFLKNQIVSSRELLEAAATANANANANSKDKTQKAEGDAEDKTAQPQAGGNSNIDDADRKRKTEQEQLQEKDKDAKNSRQAQPQTQNAQDVSATRQLDLLNDTAATTRRAVRFIGASLNLAGSPFVASEGSSSSDDDDDDDEDYDDDWENLNQSGSAAAAALSMSENRLYLQEELYRRSHTEKEETEQVLKELFSVPRPTQARKIKSSTSTSVSISSPGLQRKDSTLSGVDISADTVSTNNNNNSKDNQGCTSDFPSTSSSQEGGAVCFSAEKLGIYFENFGLHPRGVLRYFQDTDELEDMVRHATFVSQQRRRKSFANLSSGGSEQQQQQHHHFGSHITSLRGSGVNFSTPSNNNNNNNNISRSVTDTTMASPSLFSISDTNNNINNNNAVDHFTPGRVSHSHHHHHHLTASSSSKTAIVNNQNDEAISPIVTIEEIHHHHQQQQQQHQQQLSSPNTTTVVSPTAGGTNLDFNTSTTSAPKFFGSTSLVPSSKTKVPGNAGGLPAVAAAVVAGGGGRKDSSVSHIKEIPQVFEVELDDFSWWLNQRSSNGEGYNTPRTADRARHRWRVAIFAVLQTVRAQIRGLDKGASSMDLLGGGQDGGFIGFARALFNFNRENRLESTALKEKVNEAITRLDSAHDAKFRKITIDEVKQLGNADGVLRSMPGDRLSVEMMLRRMCVPVYGTSGTCVVAKKILASRVNRRATESVLLIDDDDQQQRKWGTREREEFDAVHPVNGCWTNAAGIRALQKRDAVQKTDVVERLLSKGPKNQPRRQQRPASVASSSSKRLYPQQNEDDDEATCVPSNERRSTLVYHHPHQQQPSSSSSCSPKNNNSLPPLDQNKTPRPKFSRPSSAILAATTKNLEQQQQTVGNRPASAVLNARKTVSRVLSSSASPKQLRDDEERQKKQEKLAREQERSKQKRNEKREQEMRRKEEHARQEEKYRHRTRPSSTDSSCTVSSWSSSSSSSSSSSTSSISSSCSSTSATTTSSASSSNIAARNNDANREPATLKQDVSGDVRRSSSAAVAATLPPKVPRPVRNRSSLYANTHDEKTDVDNVNGESENEIQSDLSSSSTSSSSKSSSSAFGTSDPDFVERHSRHVENKVKSSTDVAARGGGVVVRGADRDQQNANQKTTLSEQKMKKVSDEEELMQKWLSRSDQFSASSLTSPPATQGNRTEVARSLRDQQRQQKQSGIYGSSSLHNNDKRNESQRRPFSAAALRRGAGGGDGNGATTSSDVYFPRKNEGGGYKTNNSRNNNNDANDQRSNFFDRYIQKQSSTPGPTATATKLRRKTDQQQHQQNIPNEDPNRYYYYCSEVGESYHSELPSLAADHDDEKEVATQRGEEEEEEEEEEEKDDVEVANGATKRRGQHHHHQQKRVKNLHPELLTYDSLENTSATLNVSNNNNNNNSSSSSHQQQQQQQQQENRTLNSVPVLSSMTRRPLSSSSSAAISLATISDLKKESRNNNHQNNQQGITLLAKSKSSPFDRYSSPVSPLSRTMNTSLSFSFEETNNNNNNNNSNSNVCRGRRRSPTCPNLSPRDDGAKPCRTRRKLDEVIQVHRMSGVKQLHDDNLEKRTLAMEAKMMQNSVLNKIGRSTMGQTSNLYSEKILRRKL